MPTLELSDSREYIIPLFLVDSVGEEVLMDSRSFLGTAFFVSKRGDALTANHVLPKPQDLPSGKRVVAVVFDGGKQRVCPVIYYASFPVCDLALVRIAFQPTKFLEVSDEPVFAGTDVFLVGVPSHEVSRGGKEMRVLKGHVTFVGSHLELNFAIPAGMSGSPVFVGDKVVAFANGSVRSEEVEDYIEEIELLSNNKEQIQITKVTRLTHYGLAYPLCKLRDQVSPIFGGMTLMELIERRNGEP
ncbi:serine protease [Methylocaldum sp.]|uniref:S1 family peptidase n=1 Tax=Methylocaldum sp. TaxID=1969727 RepID=UPI002D346AE1|nr:serine protease [Methylocaldum sp.]HYE37832.1 serine protease [Methylocaldum sp.]